MIGQTGTMVNIYRTVVTVRTIVLQLINFFVFCAKCLCSVPFSQQIVIISLSSINGHINCVREKQYDSFEVDTESLMNELHTWQG